jgi:hypothetical protein
MIEAALAERLVAGAAATLVPLREEAEALREVFVDDANAVAAELDGAEVSLFGLIARLDAPRAEESGTFRVGARIELPRIGRVFTLDGLTLVAPRIDESRRVFAGAVRFDNDIRHTGGSTRDLFAELTGLDPDWLIVTQEVFREDAFIADISLRLDSVLATPLEIGAISLSTRGLDAKFSADLRQRIAHEMLARLSEVAGALLSGVDGLESVPDVDLLRCAGDERRECTFFDIRPGETPRFALWVAGNLEVRAFNGSVALPFKAKLLTENGPGLEFYLDADKIRENVVSLLSGALRALGPDGFDVTPLNTAPYGVEVSFALSLADLFRGSGLDLRVDRLRITTEGLDIKGPVTARSPASIPIGPVMIVAPGISVDLVNPAQIGLIGDVGLDEVTLNIVKIVSSVTTDLSNPAQARIALQGDAVVGNTVPLLSATGKATLSITPSARLSAETSAAIRKIIDGRADIELHRANKLSGLAHVAVLGLQIGSADFAFTINPGAFRAKGETSIPIGTNVMFEIEGDPSVGQLKAGGGLSLDIGSFPAASVRLGLSPASASAAISIAGMTGKIIAPSVTTITPDLVLELLKSLFKLDPASFLQAIKNREIVINLIEPGGAPSSAEIGEGDPVDGTAAPSPEGRERPENAGAEAEPVIAGDVPPVEVAADRLPPGVRPATEAGDPAAAAPPRSFSEGVTSSGEHPVVQDARGGSVEFRPYQAGPHFERVFRSFGDTEWVSFAIYNAGARNALASGAWRSYFRISGTPGPSPCAQEGRRRFPLRPGHRPSWQRPVHIVVAPGPGTPKLVAVEGGYEAPEPYSLDDFPFPFAAIGLTANRLLDQGTTLLPGDYTVLDRAVLTTISCDYGGALKVTLLNLDGPDENDVYFVESKAKTGTEEITIVARSGQSIRFSAHSPIFDVLVNDRDHPVFRFVVEAALQGRRLDLLWHDARGFLFLETEEEGRSGLVGVSSSTTRRAQIHDADQLPRRHGLERATIDHAAGEPYSFILKSLIEDEGERRIDVLAPLDLVDPDGTPTGPSYSASGSTPLTGRHRSNAQFQKR